MPPKVGHAQGGMRGIERAGGPQEVEEDTRQIGEHAGVSGGFTHIAHSLSWLQTVGFNIDTQYADLVVGCFATKRGPDGLKHDT